MSVTLLKSSAEQRFFFIVNYCERLYLSASAFHKLVMDRSGRTPVNPLKRLSTISEYSEPGTINDDLMVDQSNDTGLRDATSKNTKEDKPVEYFLLDDSPLARFTRNVKWAYQKVSRWVIIVIALSRDWTKLENIEMKGRFYSLFRLFSHVHHFVSFKCISI